MQSNRQLLEKVISTDRILVNEPMKNYTTFKVGGNADCLVKPKNIKEAEDVVRLLLANNIPFTLLGNGSNVLVSDKGIRGVTVYLAEADDEVFVDGNLITASAGMMLSKVAKAALDNALSGLEFASGIPGSVGGAIVMNAGAYGKEIKDAVSSVTMLDIETGELVTVNNKEMNFGYRTSIVKSHPFMVVKVVFELKQGDKEEIKSQMDELNARRREKQPLEYPSAGSTFKRPEGFFAAKLIEDSGLKGYRVNGAEVSKKHAGFVINKGNATCDDIVKLMKDVRRIVNEKYGVMLINEVILIGEDISL